MTKVIIAALSEIPDEAVKTITCDRGTEFAGWQKVEESLFILLTRIVLGKKAQTKTLTVF
ncbi:MAG: hypothetical protein IKB94_01325 [Clostridia bacterium]|nr:hypothetical protein [Clostridia bacterium]